MALEARKLGLSGRRPMCRDAVLLVDEFGKVVESICGQSSVDHWLALLGAQTEAPITQDDSVSPIIPLSAEETEILMEQGENFGGCTNLLRIRTGPRTKITAHTSR